MQFQQLVITALVKTMDKDEAVKEGLYVQIWKRNR